MRHRRSKDHILCIPFILSGGPKGAGYILAVRV